MTYTFLIVTENIYNVLRWGGPQKICSKKVCLYLLKKFNSTCENDDIDKRSRTYYSDNNSSYL